MASSSSSSSSSAAARAFFPSSSSAAPSASTPATPSRISYTFRSKNPGNRHSRRRSFLIAQNDSPSAAPFPFSHARIFLKSHARLLHRFRHCTAPRSTPRCRQYDATATHFGSHTAIAACAPPSALHHQLPLDQHQDLFLACHVGTARLGHTVPGQLVKFFEPDTARLQYHAVPSTVRFVSNHVGP